MFILMFMSKLNLLSLSSFRDKSYQHAYLGLEGIPMRIQKSNYMIIHIFVVLNLCKTLTHTIITLELAIL